MARQQHVAELQIALQEVSMYIAGAEHEARHRAKVVHSQLRVSQASLSNDYAGLSIIRRGHCGRWPATRRFTVSG